MKPAMKTVNQPVSAEGRRVYECIIVGAGPGGLQAAIYLGRFNRDVLIIDRGGGRTAHAKSIENFLTHTSISGKELVERGLEQAKSFNVRIEKGIVSSVVKKELFEVLVGDIQYSSKFAVVATGVNDNFPRIDNLHRFLGISFFTCVDCDGYKTAGTKLVIIGNSIETVRLSFAMKEMYTDDITLVLYFYDPPDDYKEELRDQGIRLMRGEPKKILGERHIEALELQDGAIIPCETVMSNFGFKLNDLFLKDLSLKRDAKGFKIVVNTAYESSVHGLYVVGPLNTGNDQAVIAAGEGAVAAIDINKRLLDL
jgi:thioredoxin reductase (NADPH)